MIAYISIAIIVFFGAALVAFLEFESTRVRRVAALVAITAFAWPVSAATGLVLLLVHLFKVAIGRDRS